MGKRTDDAVAKIIRLYISASFPVMREGEFNAWFASDVHRKEKDEVLAEIWNETVRVNKISDEETRIALSKVNVLLGFPPQPEDWKHDGKHAARKRRLLVRPQKKRWKNTAVRVAAVLVPVMLVMGSVFLFNVRPQKTTTVASPAEIVLTSGDSIRRIVLPDGSLLWLNMGSEVKFNAGFRDARTVELSGEGYFEVCANPRAPFSVVTKNTRTTVLGTAFNVCDYPGQEQAGVSLYRGRVKVGIGETSYSLEPEQELKYEEKSSVANIEPITEIRPAWLATPTELSYVPLSEILRLISGRFDVEVEGLFASATDDTLSIYLEGTESLEEILFRLSSMSDKYDLELARDKIIVRKK